MLLEAVKQIFEAIKLVKCPNCGAVDIYLFGNLVYDHGKRVNKQVEYNKQTRTGSVYLCGSCGFIWTDKYTPVKYHFGLK